MSQLVRNAARELRYRLIPELIGNRILIRDFDAIADETLEYLRSKTQWSLRFKCPKREYMMGSVFKYGILDLTFSIDHLAWTECDARGLTALKEFGFLMAPSLEREERVAEDSDTTCVAELYKDIKKRQAVLRLFLQDDDPEHTKQLKQLYLSGKAEAILGRRETLERWIKEYFPKEYVVADACLTNADFIWFHKHFYL